MSEPLSDAEHDCMGSGVPPSILAALRKTPAALRRVAACSWASAAMLLAFGAWFVISALLSAKSDDGFLASRVPFLALIAGASACAGWVGVQAWKAAAATREAEGRATPLALRLALLAQADAWRALAIASVILAISPVLLLGVALWALAHDFG